MRPLGFGKQSNQHERTGERLPTPHDRTQGDILIENVLYFAVLAVRARSVTSVFIKGVQRQRCRGPLVDLQGSFVVEAVRCCGQT